MIEWGTRRLFIEQLKETENNSVFWFLLKIWFADFVCLEILWNVYIYIYIFRYLFSLLHITFFEILKFNKYSFGATILYLCNRITLHKVITLNMNKCDAI